jgi:transcription termination factor Rho
MSVLDRSELEQSHLADLHAIASELGIEGYRRLGRDALIDAILAGGGGADADADAGDEQEEAPADEPEAPAKEPAATRRRGGRRLRLRRGSDDEEDAGTSQSISDAEAQAEEDDEPLATSDGDDGAEVVLPEGDDGESTAPTADEERPARKPRSRGGAGRGSRGGRQSREEQDEEDGDDDGEEDLRSGVLDILPGGSGFMRADAFVHSRDDVYVSPAQIRRCELRAGDEISGPVRPPRRSERYPSLVRVETVNGKSADETADRPLFDDFTPTFATQPLETIHALPFGKGSRVAIGGPPGAGATRLLREVTDALEGDLDVLVVLAGVRPEEVTEWKRVESLTVAGGGFDRPQDELAQIADMAVERAKRIAERGGDAVLVIDGLDALAPSAARRVFGAARNTEEGGSLTIVAATGSGGELQRLATTRVVLTADGALDPTASGTLRAELLGA